MSAKAFLRLCVLGIFLFFASAVFAATNLSLAPKTFQGKIMSIDTQQKIMVLKVRSTRKKIEISEDSTRIFIVEEDDETTRVSMDVLKKGDTLLAVVQKNPGKRGYWKGRILVRMKAAQAGQGAPQAPPSSAAPPEPSGNSCAPLPPPAGKIITVSSEEELRNAISNKASDLTILVKDGTYELSNGFWVDGSRITIRSESGNRDAVVLRGKGMKGGVSHVFWLNGNDITLADMTIGWVANHPIQIFGEAQNADRIRIHNLRIADAGEQLLKVSFNNDNLDRFPEDGIVECSLFEYTAGIGPQWYIGGIDAHHAKNWVVRDNTFRGIRSPNLKDGWAEHAIHFWSSSEGTVVERNTIINSDRGIGFGLGSAGHKGGVIRNNTITHDKTPGDVGIGLENAADAQVLNNTIFQEHDYPNAIEYRFPGTTAKISGNTVNKKIAQRDNGQAILENNITN